MRCSSCGKSGFTTINRKRYCSHCGERLATGAPAGQTLDLRQSTPAKAAAAARAQRSSARAHAAGQVHGRAVSASAVLDLRQQAAAKTARTTPKPAAATTVKPARAVSKAPSGSSAPGIIKRSTATTAPTRTASKPAARITKTRIRDTTIPRSPHIRKLPAHPAVAAKAVVPELPASVASQIESMRQSVQTVPALPPAKPTYHQALLAARAGDAPEKTQSILKIAAAVGLVAVMTAVVWNQNSPKLAFHNAAATAGIDASLPTYIPSSYRQQGDAQATPGQVAVNFTSPGAPVPLSITQRRTNWDSNSLRENYVAQQSSSYLAIQGQGLVVYLFGDQASWVNHGVWYQIAGTAKLSRDQILRMAYGL